jgi:coenzyme PQQ biosynthesis protein PqqD
MAATAPLSEAAVPRLGRGVRLTHDESRGIWVLLAPERMMELDEVATEIVKRVDGRASLGGIVDELARAFAADRDQVLADVSDFLADLAAKRIILT